MDGKKLSNPFSTGNGGAAFENKIQTINFQNLI
jgi:hypothetical protein